MKHCLNKYVKFCWILFYSSEFLRKTENIINILEENKFYLKDLKQQKYKSVLSEKKSLTTFSRWRFPFFY